MFSTRFINAQKNIPENDYSKSNLVLGTLVNIIKDGNFGFGKLTTFKSGAVGFRLYQDGKADNTMMIFLSKKVKQLNAASVKDLLSKKVVEHYWNDSKTGKELAIIQLQETASVQGEDTIEMLDASILEALVNELA